MLGIVQYLMEAKKKLNVDEDKKQGISLLDDMLNPQSDITISDFTKIFVPNGPMIYAFITPKVKDAIKIGFTDQAPEKRIEQWRKVYDDEKTKLTCIGYWSSEEFNEIAKEKQFFWDHAVHDKLGKRGYHQFKDAGDFYNHIGDELRTIHHSREFFRKYNDLSNEEKEELSDKILIDLINQMKQNIKEGNPDFKIYSSESKKEANELWNKPASYQNTDLQEEAIKNGVKAIKDGKTKLLMAAVMRFGKTHAAYEIIKEAGLKTVLVTSAKADVRTAWRTDINHKHFIDTFVFVEFNGGKLNISKFNKESGVVETYKNVIHADLETYISKDSVLIIFDTLHDLGGSIKEIKAKHSSIFNREFDIMIVDEAHYGSHANLFGKVTGLTDYVDEDDDIQVEDKADLTKAKQDANIIKDLSKNCKIMLEVSGTPYYILASNEFLNDNDTAIISKVGYTDMLKARDEWEDSHPRQDLSKSPYFGIPTLHKIGLKLTKKCLKAMKDANNSDSLSVLFKAKGNKFVNENAIIDLMKSVFGDDKGDTIGFLKNKEVEGSKTCRHTMMVLPMCKHCHIMRDLLIDNHIIDPKEREIIVIVSGGNNKADVDSSTELNEKLAALDKENKKSLVITVKRYLTGVSMPMLDSMLYLKNANSPQEYDQAIFRLCTRNTQKYKNKDNEEMLVNKKHNVYLIDFNMSNMLNMMANSARMKAIAEGNPTPKRIKELMDEDLGVTPIFCEDTNGEILGKMKSIDSKDLLKIYTNYNENKSISDIVDDDCNNFSSLFSSKSFQDIIKQINLDRDKSKKTIDTPDNENDAEDIDINTDNSLKSRIEKEISKGNSAKENKNKEYKETKEKFKAFIKELLYCNICLDKPFTSVEDIIKHAKGNDEFIDLLDDFNLNILDIKSIYNNMPVNFKELINSELLSMSILAEDMKKSDYEKFKKSISGMGAISKTEHATPDKLIEKMCNKLDKSDFEKANGILLPAEKEGEFFTYIYKHYGEAVAKKCKIVPTGKKALQLCRKALKTVGMGDYINDIIINIEDKNKNKILYDDFLNMISESEGKSDEYITESQKEFLDKYNMGKKFDICIENPPYSQRHNDNPIHFSFVEKCNKISNKNVVVMPIRLTKTTSSNYDDWKKKLSNDLISVEEIESNVFKDTGMPNVGIYVWDKNSNNENINIKYLDKEINIKSLLDITLHNKYEENILNILDNKGNITIFNLKVQYPKGTTKTNADLLRKEKCNKAAKKYEGKWLLSVNIANGGMNAIFVNKNTGKIYNSLNDAYIDWCNRNVNAIKYITFDNKTEAENCKIAMQNPVLRFALYKTQDDQNLNNKCYKYIPNIDWSDDRVRTDEGLLKVCGCPKDKIKEYAEYCKDIIKRVDNGERP